MNCQCSHARFKSRVLRLFGIQQALHGTVSAPSFIPFLSARHCALSLRPLQRLNRAGFIVLLRNPRQERAE